MPSGSELGFLVQPIKLIWAKTFLALYFVLKVLNRCILLCLVLSFHLGDGRAEPVSGIQTIEIAASRDFGYVMGDLIPLEVRITVAPDLELVSGALPASGSLVNDWLELRQVAWQEERNRNRKVYHVALGYQVFKGVREPETVTVPALALRFRQDDRLLETEAPAWSFTLVPLIPTHLPDEAVVIRGEMPVPVYPTHLHFIRLLALGAGVALLLVYLAWLRQWPPFRGRAATPFAKANRVLRGLRRQPPSSAVYQTGFRALHQALNETAGRAVFAGDLGWFIQAHPQFEAEQQQLEFFFRLSERLFYGSGGEEIPTELSLRWIEQFGRHCLKLEQRGR